MLENAGKMRTRITMQKLSSGLVEITFEKERSRASITQLLQSVTPKCFNNVQFKSSTRIKI